MGREGDYTRKWLSASVTGVEFSFSLLEVYSEQPLDWTPGVR